MSGIAGWILWNAVIFHDALYFQTGQFTKPSLWVSHADTAIGHLGRSLLTYLYAMIDNAGGHARCWPPSGSRPTWSGPGSAATPSHRWR